MVMGHRCQACRKYEYFQKEMGQVRTDRVWRNAHLLQPVGHSGRRLRLPPSRHGPHRADPVPHPRVRLRVDQPGRREERMPHTTCLMHYKYKTSAPCPSPLGSESTYGGIERQRQGHQGKDVEVISRGLIDARRWREAARNKALSYTVEQ